MSDEQRQWVGAQEAAALLAENTASYPAAKAIIADALREGKLAARAETQWRGSSRQFVHQGTGRSMLQLGKDINRLEWQSSARWRDDVDTWDWVAGRFSVGRGGMKAQNIGGFGPKYTMFMGVEFLRNEIAALVTVGEKPRTKRRGGMSPAFARWEKVYREIVSLAQARKLNEIEFPTVTKLLNHLSDKTDLSSDTIEPRVSEIWNDHIGNSKPD